MAESNVQIIVGANIGATTNTLRTELQGIAQVLSREKSVKIAVAINEGFTRDNFNKQLAQIMKSIDSKDYEIKLKTNGETFKKNIEEVSKISSPEIEVKSKIDTEQITEKIKKIQFPQLSIPINTEEAKGKLGDILTKYAELKGFQIGKIDIKSSDDQLKNYIATLQYYKEGTQEAVTATYKYDAKTNKLEQTLIKATDNQRKYNQELAKLKVDETQFSKLESDISKLNLLFRELGIVTQEDNDKFISLITKFNEIKVNPNIQTQKEDFVKLKTEIEDLTKKATTLRTEIDKFGRKEILIGDMATTKELFSLMTKVQNIASGFQKIDIGFDESTLTNFQKAESLFQILSNTVEMNKKPIEEQNQLFKEYAIAVSKAKDEINIMGTALKTATTSQKELPKFKIDVSDFKKTENSISSMKLSFNDFIKSNIGASNAVEKLSSDLNSIRENKDIKQQKIDFDLLSQSIEKTKEDLKLFKQIQESISNKQLSSDTKVLNTELGNLSLRLQKLVPPTEVTSRLSEIKRLTSEISSQDIGNKSLIEQANLAREYQTELQKVKNDTQALEKAKGFDRQTAQLKNLGQEVEAYVSKFGKLTSDAKAFAMIGEIRTGVASGDISQLDSLKGIYKDLKFYANDAGIASQTFGQKLQEVAGKYGIFLTLGTIFRGISNTIRDMITEVIKLDDAMVSLLKIVDLNEQGYSGFMDSARQSSKEIGATISDFIISTADFARIGFNLEEAQDLAKVANIYLSVADGMTSIDDATSHVVSTMKAFNMTSEQGMHVADAFNEVGKLKIA